MKADRPIDEIRELRHRMSEGCGHDPQRFIRHLQELESRYRGQVQRYEQLPQPNVASLVREAGPPKSEPPSK